MYSVATFLLFIVIRYASTRVCVYGIFQQEAQFFILENECENCVSRKNKMDSHVRDTIRNRSSHIPLDCIQCYPRGHSALVT